jgi:hypothetical protein
MECRDIAGLIELLLDCLPTLEYKVPWVAVVVSRWGDEVVEVAVNCNRT